jgi:hypothetical protein
MGVRTRRFAAVVVAALSSAPTGCTRLRYENTVVQPGRAVRATQEGVHAQAAKAILWYPARDILSVEPLRRALFGSPAWNADGEDVADSWLYTNRTPADLEPLRVAAGPCTVRPPEPPFSIEKLKTGGATRGFIGRDALGREFIFKLDHAEWPELGTSAEIIGARIMWALGYHVPQVFLVQVEGTGHAEFDGRRATAALFIEGVIGHFNFDWYRFRREMRALRLASAWIDDRDRVSTNTLVAVQDGEAVGYLIDFNSCLGSWQGRPKNSRGGRAAEPRARVDGRTTDDIVLRAVGRFCTDFAPLDWKPKFPNTAFDRMSPADMAWMVEKIRALDRRQLEAIVAAARLSHVEDAKYIVDTLMARRARILDSAPQADWRPRARILLLPHGRAL